MKKTGTNRIRAGLSMRKKRLLTELIYIAGSVIIVVFSILAFFLQEKAPYLFPVIFFLAAGLNGFSAYRYLTPDEDHKRYLGGGIFYAGAGVLLFLLALICVFLLIRR